MNKRLVITLIIILGCGILGCSKQPDSNSHTNNNTEYASEGRMSDSETYSDQTTDEMLPEEEKLDIVRGTGFHSGVAIIETASKKRLAIDTEGKILFEVGENDDILFFDGIASDGDNLIDKNGNIIASPEKTGYTGLCSPYCEGYALAYYLEETTSESIVKVGVLNGKGEWEVPLSENHKILQKMKKVEDGLFPYIYNVSEVFTNIRLSTVIADEYNNIQLESRVVTPDNNNGFIYCWGKGIFEIRLDSETFYYNAAKDRILSKIEKNKQPYKLYDFGQNTNKQEVHGDGYYSNCFANDVGSSFFCVYNEKGKEMFEPIKIETTSQGEETYKCICIDKDGYVIQKKIEGSFSYYDLKGNLQVKYENVDYMEPFYENLALVKYDGKIRYIDKSGNTVIE